MAALEKSWPKTSASRRRGLTGGGAAVRPSSLLAGCAFALQKFGYIDLDHEPEPVEEENRHSELRVRRRHCVLRGILEQRLIEKLCRLCRQAFGEFG